MVVLWLMTQKQKLTMNRLAELSNQDLAVIVRKYPSSHIFTKMATQELVSRNQQLKRKVVELYHQEQMRNQLQLLNNAVARLASSQTTDDALNITIEEAAKIVSGEGTSVWLVDDKDRYRIVCARSHAKDGRVVPGKSYYSRFRSPDEKYDGLTGYVFATGQPLRINNILDKTELAQISKDLVWSDKYKGHASQSPQDKYRPYLAVPVRSTSKPHEVTGVLRVATTINREPFTRTDEGILTLFSTFLSLVMYHTRRTEYYRELISALRSLDTIPSMDQILEVAVTAFPKLFGESHASILLRDEKDGKYHVEATSADHLKQRISGNDNPLIPYEAGEGKTGEVIETGKARLWVDYDGLDSAKPGEQCESQQPATSFMAVPLFDAEGDVRGVIRSPRSDPAPAFTSADLELLEEFAALVSDEMNTRQKHDKIIAEEIAHFKSSDNS